VQDSSIQGGRMSWEQISYGSKLHFLPEYMLEGIGGTMHHIREIYLTHLLHLYPFASSGIRLSAQSSSWGPVRADL
jgi:hypothetical protein